MGRGNDDLIGSIEAVLGQAVRDYGPVPVGFGLEGRWAVLDDGSRIAVKCAPREIAQLDVEAFMLNELAHLSELPVPRVLCSDPRLLAMSWIENDGGSITPAVECHAAELLANLHSRRFDRFGYERDTLIGPLVQPNPVSEKWVPFFRDYRLLYMAKRAYERGRLPDSLLSRIEVLADKLPDLLVEPAHPSLIHGDLWTGNVLVQGGRIAGFVDPAIYFAHPEIELAFTTMFGTFGAAFFDAYEALCPLEPGFHEVRCALYNLYPNLVHARLFGSAYHGAIDTTLRRLGF